jgi:4-hydroxybenzoate polyprenyltransferase
MDWVKRPSGKAGIFFEMIRWEHSAFCLPFAYLGLFLARKGIPDFYSVFWVTLAMVSFRTMAMGFNRLLDQAIDAANPRTADRALPSGKLRRPFVWAVCFFSLLVFAGSAYVLRPLCFYLSPVPVAWAAVYPLTKRFTWLSHFVLGMILGMAPYGAWLAGGGDWSWSPALISAGVVFWTAGFDIIYALQDIDFDRSSGLHSIPARFGPSFGVRTARFFHLISVVFWFSGGWLAGLRGVYVAGLAGACALLVREHWLVRTAGLKRLQEAFFVMNAAAGVVLFAAAVADLTLR